jgi:hypothetical protein
LPENELLVVSRTSRLLRRFVRGSDVTSETPAGAGWASRAYVVLDSCYIRFCGSQPGALSPATMNVLVWSGAACALGPTSPCPVTLPNGSVPADAADWGPADSYGNGKLWTLFWPYGVALADEEWVEKDGSIGVKWPWWRDVTGRLKIEGRRLDKSGGRLRADIPSAYGVRGFQPTSIYFASEGCWEVTGRAGGTSLTFVTVVAKASTYGLELKRG